MKHSTKVLPWVRCLRVGRDVRGIRVDLATRTVTCDRLAFVGDLLDAIDEARRMDRKHRRGSKAGDGL